MEGRGGEGGWMSGWERRVKGKGGRVDGRAGWRGGWREE